eukprot:8516604-Alexandrium_andersonii.AAC.1
MEAAYELLDSKEEDIMSNPMVVDLRANGFGPVRLIDERSPLDIQKYLVSAGNELNQVAASTS